jgi:hypothetical protein
MSDFSLKILISYVKAGIATKKRRLSRYFCKAIQQPLGGAAIKKHLYQPRVRVLVNAILVLLLVY